MSQQYTYFECCLFFYSPISTNYDLRQLLTTSPFQLPNFLGSRKLLQKAIRHSGGAAGDLLALSDRKTGVYPLSGKFRVFPAETAEVQQDDSRNKISGGRISDPF